MPCCALPSEAAAHLGTRVPAALCSQKPMKEGESGSISKKEVRVTTTSAPRPCVPVLEVAQLTSSRRVCPPAAAQCAIHMSNVMPVDDEDDEEE